MKSARGSPLKRGANSIKGGFSLRELFTAPYACKQTTALVKRTNHILVASNKEVVRTLILTNKKGHRFGVLFCWWGMVDSDHRSQ